MQCKNCKFYVPSYSPHGFDKSKGQCEINLPPHIAVLYYEGDRVNITVEATFGCDLGQEK